MTEFITEYPFLFAAIAIYAISTVGNVIDNAIDALAYRKDGAE